MRKHHPMTVAVAIALIALAVVASMAIADDNSPPARTDQPEGGQPLNPPVVPPMVVLKKDEVEAILGKEVRSAAGEDMGRIVDVVVDRAGQVRAAVIDFGGFLGVGSRKVAVDWNALSFSLPGAKGARVTLELTRDQVKAGPEYQDGKPVVVLGPLGKLEPFSLQ
jgi:sporulation protein YlmC with PRC-barrel domain